MAQEQEKIYYRKLVRDKIPDIIKKNGGECKIKLINDKSMPQLTLDKVNEELTELNRARTNEQVLYEAADLVIALLAHLSSLGMGVAHLNAQIRRSLKEKGGFSKNQVLIWATKK